jgi:hypothetical protein
LEQRGDLQTEAGKEVDGGLSEVFAAVGDEGVGSGLYCLS